MPARKSPTQNKARGAAKKKPARTRKTKKSRNPLIAWMQNLGIPFSGPYAAALVTVLILAAAGLYGITQKDAPANAPLERRERRQAVVSKRNPAVAQPSRTPAARQERPARAPSSSSLSARPVPRAPAPEPEAPRYAVRQEQAFEETTENRLEDAIKRVDAALFQALTAQRLPYEIHLNEVELREHADEIYHYQKLHILFRGTSAQKNAAVGFLRTALARSFQDSTPATSLTPLSADRWFIGVGGVATHEVLFVNQETLPAPRPGRKARLAIVIDDIGENKAMLREFLALDAPLSFAVLPHSTHAAEAGRMIRASGNDLLLHHPMEPQRYPAVNPGPGAIFAQDGEARIRARLQDNLRRVPGVVGINNHMGSLFTSDVYATRMFLAALAGKDLFVLDSLTTPQSKLYEQARALGLRAYRRDVFLDDVDDKARIRYELAKAVRLAQSQGSAIAIGHPRPETLAALKEWLKNKEQKAMLVRLHELPPASPAQ